VNKALLREFSYPQTLRSQLALLEEKIMNCMVSKANKEEEIKRIKEENIL
jgi:hypothetical protein